MDKKLRKEQNNKKRKKARNSDSDDILILDETSEKPEKQHENMETKDTESETYKI